MFHYCQKELNSRDKIKFKQMKTLEKVTKYSFNQLSYNIVPSINTIPKCYVQTTE